MDAGMRLRDAMQNVPGTLCVLCRQYLRIGYRLAHFGRRHELHRLGHRRVDLIPLILLRMSLRLLAIQALGRGGD